VIEEAELRAAVRGEFGLPLLVPPVDESREAFFVSTPKGSAERLTRGRPYGRTIKPWLEGLVKQAESERVACLVPARTETAWFQELCFACGEVHFLRGRVRFEGQRGGAPFPSAVVVLGPGTRSGGVFWWDWRRLF